MTAASFVSLAYLLMGCAGTPPGYGSGPPPAASTQVAITTQPTNQYVPIGRPATFTVVATGTAPLSYQWSENGAPIEGATSASYTTPTVALSDSGSTFQVTVSNSVNSATSSAATLTPGARAPAIGDLRYLLFQQVTVPGFGSGGNGEVTGVLNGLHLSFNNALGSPLMLGSSADCISDGCAYPLFEFSLPPPTTGLSTYYQAAYYDGSYSDFNSGVISSFGPNVVIFSLDFELAAQTYGMAWVTTTQPGGFDYRMEAVAPDQIQATAGADGAKGRIITAVTFDDTSGNAILISYGWQGDMTTAYDAQTVVASGPNVASQAASLANQGYFISAFGGNDNDGYILVGMRVQGDTMPRPVSVGTQAGVALPPNPDNAYYTTVVYLEYAGNHALIQEQ